MSEMLEKIARAIAKSKGINPDMCVSGAGGTPGQMTVCYQYAWELELIQARAAVEAMREPDEMTMSRMETTITEALHSHPDIPLDAYSPMINVRPIAHEMLKTFIDAILRDEP